MTIKIDKGIPIPATSSAGVALYPFESMEVGDSFFAPGKKREQMDNACGHWRKKKGWKFAVRLVSEMGTHPETGAETPIEGCRVWRKE